MSTNTMMTTTNERSSGLRIRGLHKRIGAQQILDDIHLDLDPGEMLILVGLRAAANLPC